jgi:RimJ/RimL family protein N-acetyltransferase
VSFRWRLRSATPSYESFVATLFQGVLVQYVLADPATDRPLGTMALYNADFRNQLAYLAVLVDPALQRTPMGLDALVLFLNQAFTAWDLRKIYAETTDLSYASFASGKNRLFRVEGTYPGHELFAGRAWTMYMLAFYRSEWAQLMPKLLPRAVGDPALQEANR